MNTNAVRSLRLFLLLSLVTVLLALSVQATWIDNADSNFTGNVVINATLTATNLNVTVLSGAYRIQSGNITDAQHVLNSCSRGQNQGCVITWAPGVVEAGTTGLIIPKDDIVLFAYGVNMRVDTSANTSAFKTNLSSIQNTVVYGLNITNYGTARTGYGFNLSEFRHADFYDVAADNFEVGIFIDKHYNVMYDPMVRRPVSGIRITGNANKVVKGHVTGSTDWHYEVAGVNNVLDQPMAETVNNNTYGYLIKGFNNLIIAPYAEGLSGENGTGMDLQGTGITVTKPYFVSLNRTVINHGRGNDYDPRFDHRRVISTAENTLTLEGNAFTGSGIVDLSPVSTDGSPAYIIGFNNSNTANNLFQLMNGTAGSGNQSLFTVRNGIITDLQGIDVVGGLNLKGRELYGVKNMSSTGGWTGNSAGTITAEISRGATSNFASYVLDTGLVQQWSMSLRNDNTNNMYIKDLVNSVNTMVFTQTAAKTKISLIADINSTGDYITSGNVAATNVNASSTVNTNVVNAANSANISNFIITGGVINYTNSGQELLIDNGQLAGGGIGILKELNMHNNTIQQFHLEVSPNQTCIMPGPANNTGAIWQEDTYGRISICDPGMFPTTNGIGVIPFMSDVYTIVAANSGAAYGDTISANTTSVFEGGVRGLAITAQNISAEALFAVEAGNGDDGNGVAGQIVVTGRANTLSSGAVGLPAASATLILDSARKSVIANTIGQNLSVNIGSAGGFAATDQYVFTTQKLMVMPDKMMQLQPNTTSLSCNSTNLGSIIFSNSTTTPKHYGCDGTNWNALY